jgi:EAL domain-containing protein (putative c-di-GMP-specific phosphodiesterase class I)
VSRITVDCSRFAVVPADKGGVKLWESRGERSSSTAESTRWILWARDGWARPEATGDVSTANGASRGGDPSGNGAPPAPGPLAPAPAPANPPSGDGPPAAEPPRRTDAGAPIHEIIDRRDVAVVYQPVFDANLGHVVGFEALARGPEGPLQPPRRLFAAARAVGRAGELDWICRAVAFRTMMDAELHPSLSLFVNVEPDALITPCPEDLLPVIWEAETRLRVFIDIAGQSLVRHPIEVLESVRRARAAGWGVVLNDLEVSAAALSLLPTLEPDLIRLDQRVIRHGSERSGEALTAALTEAEQRGTALLVDNVEERPGTIARFALAGYLQGHYLGAEGPLPATVPTPVVPVPLRDPETTGLTPWQVIAESGGLMSSGVADESVDRLVRQFVTQAARATGQPVVGVVTSRYRRTTAAAAARHREALENAPVTLLVGQDMGVYGDWRTRAAEPPADHPLAAELCLVALAATHASVLAARPTAVVNGQATSWDVGVSHNPPTVRRVMRELLHHVDRLAGGVRAQESR